VRKIIVDIYKDYSITEMAKFAKEHSLRYENLCRIVGEFALGVRHLYLGIVLPYSGDKGCITAATLKDSEINIIDVRYF